MNEQSRQPASQKTHRTLNLLGGLFTVIAIGVATVAFTTRDKSPETTTTDTPTVASPTTSSQLFTADTSSLTTISNDPDTPDTTIDQIDSAPPSSETTSSVEKDLSGKVVVLDPGHNGGNSAHSAEINRQVPAGGFMKACDTSGTQTYGGYPEHAFTYDVSNRAATALRERGATVYLTRDNDTGVGPCVDVRAASGGNFNADVALSIHADGGPDGGRGFHILPPTGCTGCMNQIVEPSAQFAGSPR